MAARNAEFLAKPTWNPLEVISDPRVAMTGAGLFTAYAKRKALYKGFRDVFGVAVLGDDGRIHYYALNADGTTDTTREVPQAFLNRVLVNLGDSSGRRAHHRAL